MGVLQNQYVKYLLTGVLIFVGISGGIYVGYALTGGQKGRFQSEDISPDQGGHDPQPFVKEGDIFPTLPCVLPDSTPSDIKSIIGSGRAVILFSHPGCQPCKDLIEYWRAQVRPNIKKPILFVIAIDYSNWPYEGDLNGLGEVVLVRYDRYEAKRLYNIITMPTLFGIDKGGRIKVVQAQFPGNLSREFMRFLRN